MSGNSAKPLNLEEVIDKARSSIKKNRKRYTPTPEARHMVEVLAKCGVRVLDICAALRIGSLDTFYKYHRDDYQKGALAVHAKIGASIIQKALNGDTTCMIFVAKTKMGWTEEDSIARHVDKAVNAKLEVIEEYRLSVPENGREYSHTMSVINPNEMKKKEHDYFDVLVAKPVN